MIYFECFRCNDKTQLLNRTTSLSNRQYKYVLPKIFGNLNTFLFGSLILFSVRELLNRLDFIK